MKDVCIYLQVESYMGAWLRSTLGNPVRFPKKSSENALLSRIVTTRPDDAPPEVRTEDSVAIVLPDNAERRPEFYNYLGRRARSKLLNAIDCLFRLHLWSECAPLIAARGELNKGIDEWCARHGIALDHREAVRQKFYRMRKSYNDHGIVLGKKYNKKCTKSLPLSRSKSYTAS